MKAFHFTLEAVRTLRQRNEQKALERYAQALLSRQRAMERLDAAQRELDRNTAALTTALQSGSEALKISQINDYQRVLTTARDEAAKMLGDAERQLNVAHQAMIAARQQREIVDKFFDKQKAQHQRGLLQSEQKMLDDLAGRRNSSLFAWNSTPHPS